MMVNKALNLLVRSESRNGILRYYGSGIWKVDLESSRRVSYLILVIALSGLISLARLPDALVMNYAA